MSLKNERLVAMDAALGAAIRVREVYDGAFTVGYKDDARDDPVTRADELANAYIVERLRAAFPDDAIVAEESDVPEGFERSRRCWFVDPLDGTKEFVAKIDEFCTMIGLAIDGRAALGVVCVPTNFDRYVGEVGVGACLVERRVDNDARGTVGEESPLHASTSSDASRARIVVSRSRRSPLLDVVFSALGSPTEIQCGSVGMKVAMLARARADAYVHPSSGRTGGGMKKWDTCAPEAILVAAGGSFTDESGAPIDYAQPDVAVRDGVVASNGKMHRALIDAIASAKRARK